MKFIRTTTGSVKKQKVVVLNCFMGRIVPVEYAKRAKYQPPAMRVRDGCYTKKSPFRYNEVVQAYHNERKGDFNG